MKLPQPNEQPELSAEDTAASRAVPDFVVTDPRLAAIWERGELKMTSDLLIPQPTKELPVEPPQVHPRGLGSRAVLGWERYEQSHSSAPEATQPVSSPETLEEKVARLGKKTPLKDLQAARTDTVYNRLDARRLSGVYYKDQGGVGIESLLDKPDTSSEPEPNTVRGTIEEQNAQERRAQAIHFKVAGRYQRRRS